MSFQNPYLDGLMERVIRRNPAEPEFHQAVREVLQSLDPVVTARPVYITEGVMECLVEPERIIKFRVPWEDDQGNIYYQSRDGKRRWVIYNGESEASRVAPEWHGWLHHTFKEPPTRDPLVHKPWELPHEPNLTGTPEAYHPKGSLYLADPKKRHDYDAWQPDQ